MSIRNIIYSPFFLSLIVPSVLSLPHPAITEAPSLPTPAADLESRQNGGGCIVFVNARDVAGQQVSCTSNAITVRDVPTATETPQQALVTPTATSIPEIQDSFDEELSILPILPLLPIKKRQEEEPDPDCPRCPYVNARSPQDESEEEEGIVPKLGNSRVGPFINARDESVTEVHTDPATPPPPFVNARSAQDEVADGELHVDINPPPPFVNARSAEDGDDTEGDVDGEVHINALPPPYVNARRDANMSRRTRMSLEIERR
ncbi:MAG: hypothetical protein Q9160_009245 [Pyrenula sp. 1 TL-2023]